MVDQSEIDDLTRTQTDNPDEENQLINNLGRKLEADRIPVKSIVSSLADRSTDAQIRIIRALDGQLPPADFTLADLQVSDDPTFLFYLLHSVRQPLSPSTFNEVQFLVTHDVNYVAAEAAKQLAKSYSVSIEDVENILVPSTRDVVLIKTLRTLYQEQAFDHSWDIHELVRGETRSQVQFYASLLMKSVAPDQFEELVQQSDYIESFDRKVSVALPDQGDVAH